MESDGNRVYRLQSASGYRVLQCTAKYLALLWYTGERGKPNNIFILTQTLNYMNLEKIFRFKKVLDRYLQSSRTKSFTEVFNGQKNHF